MLRPVRVTVDALARLYSDLLVEKPSLLFLFGLNGRFKGFFVFLLEKGKCMHSTECTCLDPFKVLFIANTESRSSLLCRKIMLSRNCQFMRRPCQKEQKHHN